MRLGVRDVLSNKGCFFRTKRISGLYLSLILLLACHAHGAPTQTDESVSFLPQAWSKHERQWFYFANQGSQLMPYAIFLHLEQADSETKFRADSNIRRFGYLPSSANQFNPDGMPVGFTRDANYLGLTCAACHTGEIRLGSRVIYIDGGQGNGDLQALLAGLKQALSATNERTDKRERLFRRLQQTHRLDSQAASLLLADATKMIEEVTERNATNLEYGYSRLDAFGAILNKGLSLTGVSDNVNEPMAPTSYPYIWDTPQHDWVEWNGSSPNPLEGALARNVGEVVGVFGHVEHQQAKWLGLIDAGYRSSIKTRTLRRIEKHVKTLVSPRWVDAGFPPIEEQLVTAGRTLYEQHCASCHLDIKRDDPARSIKVRMSSLDAVGTDPTMAESAIKFMGKSGRYEGGKRFYRAGDTLNETAPSLYIVNHVMGGVMWNSLFQTLLSRRDAKSFGHGSERHPIKFLDGKAMERGTETSEAALLAYKARPLNGIWATPPYLHNGSVPNMYELMLPAEQRSVTFDLGSWQYDVKRMGYVTEDEVGDSFQFDTRLPGNSNAGHEWGTGRDGKPALSETEIYSIIE